MCVCVRERAIIVFYQSYSYLIKIIRTHILITTMLGRRKCHKKTVFKNTIGNFFLNIQLNCTVFKLMISTKHLMVTQHTPLKLCLLYINKTSLKKIKIEHREKFSRKTLFRSYFTIVYAFKRMCFSLLLRLGKPLFFNFIIINRFKTILFDLLKLV